MIGDTELVEAAHRGDAPSLGLLLERYRPRLYAIALGILGYGAQAEDAVHDAFLIALRKIDTLLDPEAVRAWLDAVVRNVCRMYLRAPRAASLDVRVPRKELVAQVDDPEAHLDQLCLKDWLWTALSELPETLRPAMLLRHFGSYASYEEISAILAVPVGTVRSRLAEGRRKLSEALTGGGRPADSDERRRRESWNQHYANAFHRLYDGRRDEFISHYRADLELFSGRKRFRGRAKLEFEVDGDLETGTLSDPVRVISSGNVTVIDCRVTNPPNDPTRCPPGYSLVICRKGDQAHRAYLHPGARLPHPA